MIKKMKVAFAGASGTGKTTLMENVKKYVEFKSQLSFEICPVGSREVIKDLGLQNPYDVDILGKRKEFQHLLFEKKSRWEENHDLFFTDRTHFDNLTYSIMHDCINTVENNFFDKVIEKSKEYDLVIFCKISRFHHFGDDPCRVKDLNYHRIYEQILDALISKHLTKVIRLTSSHFDEDAMISDVILRKLENQQ